MITVIGYDGSPLSVSAAKALASATLVVGGRRHLAAVDVPEGVPTIVLGDVGSAVDAIATTALADGDVVVVASGDPGFFGIVRLLRERGLRPIVVPALSSVAAACARAGVSWDDAVVVSAHGRDLRRAVNACRRFAKVVVLTAPGAGPAELAGALIGHRDSRFVVAERLGEPDERVVDVSLAEAVVGSWREPHVVVALCGDNPSGTRTFAGPVVAGDAGLPDEAYACQAGRITKAEIRAWAVARLAPTVGDLVWDLGAGSGSVGIECARRGAAVVLVERSPGALADIAANLAAHAVPAQVVAGDAIDVIDGLAEPDAVFLGGGGFDVLQGALRRQPSRIVATLASVDRIAAYRDAIAAAGYAVEGTVVSASRLATLPDGTWRMAAINPVVVLSGVLS